MITTILFFLQAGQESPLTLLALLRKLFLVSLLEQGEGVPLSQIGLTTLEWHTVGTPGTSLLAELVWAELKCVVTLMQPVCR